MKILALETSTRVGSVALFEGDALLEEAWLDRSRRTARALAPGIRDLLKQHGWPPADVELVAVTCGPGSFTGLRLGVTTAKTFAYAVDAEVLGVNTLAAIAERAPAGDAPLVVALDAGRGEVFTATFGAGEGEETRIVPVNRWLAELPAPARVSGPALETLADRLPSGVTAVPREVWQPSAAATAALAARHYQSGRRETIWELSPQYYRPSAAEEKRMAKK